MSAKPTFCSILASGLALGVVIWALRVKLKKVKEDNISFFIYL
jgi:hypothetical protein